MMSQQRLRRRIKRAEKQVTELTAKKAEGRLNEHGNWSLGYWLGDINVLEEWLDELDGKGEGE